MSRRGRSASGSATVIVANGDSGTITVISTGYQVVLVIGGVAVGQLRYPGSSQGLDVLALGLSWRLP